MVLAGFAIAFVLAGQNLLPDHYSFDEVKIQGVAQGTQSYAHDPSFQRVGEIYRYVGLADRPLLAGLLGFVAFAVALSVGSQFTALGDRFSLYLVMLMCGCVILGAVYLGRFSKDIFVLLVVVYPLLATRRHMAKGEVAVMAALMAYAAIFRTYWWMVVAVYALIRVASIVFKVRPTLTSLAVMLVGFVIAAVWLFPLFLGVEVEHFREQVNLMDVRADTGSRIDPIVPGDNFVADVANLLLVEVNLQFPVVLAIGGGLLYVGVAGFLTALWVGFYRAALTTSGRRGVEPGFDRAVALCLAFVLVQGIFEPDYGSAVRHLAPLLPLLLYVVTTRHRDVEFGRRRTRRHVRMRDSHGRSPSGRH